MFLNLDAGELETETEELYGLFDLLNCACGGHAGDPKSIARVVAFCARDAQRSVHLGARRSVQLGAHPSYPDREHFGRRSIAITPDDLAGTVAAQCRTLAGVAAARNLPITFITSIKPHGALYHDAARSSALADAVLRGAITVLGGVDFTVIGPPTGALRAAAGQRGLRYAAEGFADRRMDSDGMLIPRTEPGALITDPEEAARQAILLSMRVDTLCVHADTPGAIDIARAVREAIDLERRVYR